MLEHWVTQSKGSTYYRMDIQNLIDWRFNLFSLGGKQNHIMEDQLSPYSIWVTYKVGGEHHFIIEIAAQISHISKKSDLLFLYGIWVTEYTLIGGTEMTYLPLLSWLILLPSWLDYLRVITLLLLSFCVMLVLLEL